MNQFLRLRLTAAANMSCFLGGSIGGFVVALAAFLLGRNWRRIMSWCNGPHPLDVYDGPEPVCQTHTPEQASLIVSAVNAYLVARQETAARCLVFAEEAGISALAEKIKREFSL